MHIDWWFFSIPFYSCALNDLVFKWKQGWGCPGLDTNPPFHLKCNPEISCENVTMETFHSLQELSFRSFRHAVIFLNMFISFIMVPNSK